LLTIFYVFSMIGMELFGKTIQTQEYYSNQVYDCKNPNLINTDFTKLVLA
jgi:hypothetical protein